MTSEALQKARRFEAQYKAYADSSRPAFHLTAPVGWMNDPNGFSVYQGEYHLFFQYYPYHAKWGSMHWGHARTKDFVTWEYLPAAMAPDTDPDRDGCYSGSAVETPDGQQMLMYTGVYNVRRVDGVVDLIQHQCIALGDGVNYVKYEGNPVLDASDLPSGTSELDFRDPKIWREGDHYCAVVSSRGADGSGWILLYESADGFHWSYRGVLAECKNEYGKMWECPDFFPLDGTQVLMVSPMEMMPTGMEFHAGYGTVAFWGSYDPSTHRFDREHVQAIDYGIDFYAPQTLETPDGRRIMVAWMQNWATSTFINQNSRLGGQMTLPRELHIRDGRLVQNPVREIEAYRGEGAACEDVSVSAERTLEGVQGRVLDLSVTLRPGEGGYEWFKLRLAKNGEHCAIIRYKPSANTIRIDRSHCSARFDIVHLREFLVRPRDGVIRLRILMDTQSVELFVNDGEQAATFLLYDSPEAEGISFEAKGEAKMDVEFYPLNVRSPWNMAEACDE